MRTRKINKPQVQAALANTSELRQCVAAMVFSEIKPQLEQLTHDEMLKAMAYMKHRLQAEDPEYQRELARRHAEMDAGQKVRWEDLKKQLGLS